MTARYPGHKEKFFSKLTRLEETAKGWKCSCPAHDDTNPSMSVWLCDDGWVGIKCFAGCTREDILQSIGCTLADLGPYRPERVERMGSRVIEKEYKYVDENGRLLYETLRFNPKDFRQRRPDGHGGYLYDLKDTRRVLYHLDELVNSNRVVFLVEGEKDVDNLRSLGLLATCNPMGAGKWDDEYTKTLKGRAVCIIPDHDPQDKKTGKRPGWEHALLVGGKLLKHVSALRILQLDIEEGKDVSDWIAAGGTKEQLMALYKATPPITHPEAMPAYLPHGAAREAPQTPARAKPRKVRLTAEELSSAAHKGVMRVLRQIHAKRRPDGWTEAIEQACREQAAKKATHRYFVGEVGTYADSNIAVGQILHVRQSATVELQSMPAGTLLMSGVMILPTDNDDDIFVVVEGVSPAFTVLGWVGVADAKNRLVSTEAGYLFPASELNDIKSLPPELDDGQDGS